MEEQDLNDIFSSSGDDICETLTARYGKSSAPQHRHLCATAAALRSVILAESLPLSPHSYFAAAISSLSDGTLDSTAVAALSTLLSIVIPLLPQNSLSHSKASDAILVLVEVSKRPNEVASTSTLRCVVKCLGVLIGFCDLADWNSVKLPSEFLLKFSVDKRPKVRKCAQDYLEKIFKSIHSSASIKDPSKLVRSSFKSCMPLAVELCASRIEMGSISNPRHIEVLHMLHVLRLLFPFLTNKVKMKIVKQLEKLVSSLFSALTKHIFDIFKVFLETSPVELIIPEAENIITSLVSYISLREKNPRDTVISAATLLQIVLDKLCVGESTAWVKSLPLVFGSIAGLLTSEDSTASQASNILKELIHQHLNKPTSSNNEKQLLEEGIEFSSEAGAIRATCAVLGDVLSCSDGIPNKHILEVVSASFLKLGDMSFFYLKDILLKLSDLMNLTIKDVPDTKPLQDAIGCAVIAMGPERILTLLPISICVEELAYQNMWLVPVLRKYVSGSSLGFYMDHIVPLAKSFQVASKAENSVIKQELQAHARGLLGLIPAFCQYPTDTNQNFGSLAKFLITLLKDSSMHESIATALQVLVNQNRSILGFNISAHAFENYSSNHNDKETVMGFRSLPCYSKKVAARNIKALALHSEELLQALTNKFFSSSPKKRSYIKDAIGCLACISDSSITKKIFISSIERFHLQGVLAAEKSGNEVSASHGDEEENVSNIEEKDVHRCLVMELGSSFVGGANEDLVDETKEIGRSQACYALQRILEEHPWFLSSQFSELTDLLLGLKSANDVATVRSRFACLHILFVHALKTSLKEEEENTKAFLILNEIILAMKDSREESRKVAYDNLLVINSSLKSLACGNSDAPHQKLIGMIMGYLSGSSPQIKSGAVSALSVLVYKDANICLSIPELIPTVLDLLQTKAVEVVKAVLGFVKVAVSCLQAIDLQNFLSDISDGILPWSSVTVILEIMIRKCGSAAVVTVAPEKYKGFIKSILENRHSKSNSKEAAASENASGPTDSLPKGLKKRKHMESSLSLVETGSIKAGKKRKGGENEKFRTASKDETGTSFSTRTAGYSDKRFRLDFNQKKSSKGYPKGRKNRRDFERAPSKGEKNMKLQTRKNEQKDGNNNLKSQKHKKFMRPKKTNL
ncbi:putative domain NUC173 [Dillenia turbinata]|uniref:Domain NUC173 n=1 Tax=Dillenia turbinata TaxID=194707 RepID=A0AAN8ZPF7_9MAGN